MNDRLKREKLLVGLGVLENRFLSKDDDNYRNDEFDSGGDESQDSYEEDFDAR